MLGFRALLPIQIINKMPKEKFVLVSLKENKAKELAQVISNESCRKILDYLAENNDATETQLAEKLQLPISTVHYNLKHLLAGSLITADEYHYSEKGKEVNHYKLANKYIIIAPKTTYGIKEKLKSILPVGLIALATAGFIQLYLKYFGKTQATIKVAPELTRGAIAPVVQEAADEAVYTATEKAVEAAPKAVPEAALQTITTPNYALWFLFGCLFVLILVIIFEFIRAKKENK